MMLVKRGIAGEGAVEEVLVGQASNPDYPKGRIFLTDGRTSAEHSQKS